MTGRPTRTAIAAAIAAAFALAGCGGQEAETAAAPAPPTVSVIEVASISAQGSIRASGLVLYKRETALAFNVPGLIATLSVDEGQSVRTGQQLAALRLTAVQAGAREADAALQTAEANLRRQQTLFDRGLVAQARLDDAELQVERARAARDAAGFNRDTAVLTAPAAGVILRRQAEPAQVVAAGQPVLVLGETGSGLIVRANVSSAQAARIRRGAAATISFPEQSQPRAGVVELIAAKSDAATGVFDIEIRLTDPSGLRSGTVAQVQIAAEGGGAGAQAMAVPLLSLLDARADQGVVYIVDASGVARRTAIRTAGVVDDQVLVLEGLNPGDRVVASGAAFVRDGEAVTVAPHATAQP